MKRSATAVWQGGLKDGKGTISTESKALADAVFVRHALRGRSPARIRRNCSAPRTPAASRWRSPTQLGEAGIKPERIDTKATITLEKLDTGLHDHARRISTSPSRRPARTAAKFEEAAQKAKAGCPLSKVLKAEISMDARLDA